MGRAADRFASVRVPAATPAPRRSWSGSHCGRSAASGCPSVIGACPVTGQPAEPAKVPVARPEWRRQMTRSKSMEATVGERQRAAELTPETRQAAATPAAGHRLSLRSSRRSRFPHRGGYQDSACRLALAARATPFRRTGWCASGRCRLAVLAEFPGRADGGAGQQWNRGCRGRPATQG